MMPDHHLDGPSVGEVRLDLQGHAPLAPLSEEPAYRCVPEDVGRLQALERLYGQLRMGRNELGSHLASANISYLGYRTRK